VRRDFKYNLSLFNQTFGYDKTALVMQNFRHSIADFEVVLEDVLHRVSLCLALSPVPMLLHFRQFHFGKLNKVRYTA
jgi:hypothetical protein